MTSHSYEFTGRDLLRAFAPLGCFVLVAVTMMAFGQAVLPRPKPILDADRTILIHQAEASRSASSYDIILMGDSSCLMDVNARQLEQLTGRRVLNLGTLSHLDLDGHAYLLNAGLAGVTEPKTVVLLMHPESLRMASRAPYFKSVMLSYFRGTDFHPPGQSAVMRLTQPIRERFLSRVLPIPLGGAYGQYYGFNRDLWNHLTENNGSALDPHTYPSTPPPGNPEYRLAAQLESASRNFASRLPEKVRLIAGITPSPSNYVFRNHSLNCRVMLETWSVWLAADASLTNMPFVLTPERFATTTHLNARGVAEYTERVAESLRVLQK